MIATVQILTCNPRSYKSRKTGEERPILDLACVEVEQEPGTAFENVFRLSVVDPEEIKRLNGTAKGKTARVSVVDLQLRFGRYEAKGKVLGFQK
ncbi:MAG: hypothetical protein KGS61_03075 [Verrucomicrobia bacterium]|nr:hypothetical protein [Verrucomicrobiota bacterium]